MVKLSGETERIVIAAISSPNFFDENTSTEGKVQSVIDLINAVEKAINK